jgi:hypothetical protein
MQISIWQEGLVAVFSCRFRFVDRALGLRHQSEATKATSEAAQLMPQLSVEARPEARGKEEFRRRLKNYGKCAVVHKVAGIKVQDFEVLNPRSQNRDLY